MSPVLQQDAEALHRALATADDDVSVSLSRETAEFLARVVDAQVSGHEIVFSRVPEEVSPADAARILAVSRPHVYKLMDQGDLPFRTIGTHRRIPVADLRQFQESERTRRHQALEDLLDLENDLGLDE